MTILRNLLFFAIILYVATLNFFMFLDRMMSAVFYFNSLTIIIALLIISEIIYAFITKDRIQTLKRNNERLELHIMDTETEVVLLQTLSDILDAFNEEVSLSDVLEKIAESVKNTFKEDTVVLQLIGESFKKCVLGKNVDIPEEILGGLILKPRPVLVNNTSSFSEYKYLAQQGVSSFIMTTLHYQSKITGVLGVFSFDNRVFTLKNLKLLRMVTGPTSLLVENTTLFEKTKVLSITDALTSVYNRRQFETIFDATLRDSKEKNISVCMADIDYFKCYNDCNGHPAGDYALQKIAEIMKRSVKGSDIVARYGGEEFILLFPDTCKENAVHICETIREHIKAFKFPNEEAQPDGNLTISMGVSTYPEDGETKEELVKQADLAMYKAKELGRNKVLTP